MTRGEALALADRELSRHGWLDRLPQDDRREIEDLVEAVALRIAETLEAFDAAVYNAPTSSAVPAILLPMST